MVLLRWYNPQLIRMAVLVAVMAVSIATGGGLAIASDDWGGP